MIIALNSQQIKNLDLSPVTQIISPLLQTQKTQGSESKAIAGYEQKLQFNIDYPREATDPRELSEIPEIRLWFIRLDAYYPWLPLMLNWKEGELARYTAMLVPHQFKRNEGIEYNQEALDIFIMQKAFILTKWLQQYGIPSQNRIKSMAQTLGYDLDDRFFSLL